MPIYAIKETIVLLPATFWLALYPVATWGGASGSRASVATLGTGSAGAVAQALSASQRQRQVGVDFDFPAAGFYVASIAVTGAAVATGAHVEFAAKLQGRKA